MQAIRCCGCGRLRPYGNTEGTLNCMCGARRFFASFPMPGEEAWAIKCYEKELKETGEWFMRLPSFLRRWF